MCVFSYLPWYQYQYSRWAWCGGPIDGRFESSGMMLLTVRQMSSSVLSTIASQFAPSPEINMKQSRRLKSNWGFHKQRLILNIKSSPVLLNVLPWNLKHLLNTHFWQCFRCYRITNDPQKHTPTSHHEPARSTPRQKQKRPCCNWHRCETYRGETGWNMVQMALGEVQTWCDQTFQVCERSFEWKSTKQIWKIFAGNYLIFILYMYKYKYDLFRSFERSFCVGLISI